MTLRHYYQKSKTLGPRKTLHRLWQRSAQTLHLRWKIFKARWVTRKEISDAQLLSHLGGNWPTVSDFCKHLKTRPEGTYLFAIGPVQTPPSFLLDHLSAYSAAVIQAADEICTGHLTILGHTIDAAAGIDWHKDPLSDFRWPVLYHEEQAPLHLWPDTRPADLVMVWELNRHQHFILLGLAYFLTGDDRYAQTFAAQITHWIDTNPPEQGIHWCESMEIALRLIAWTASFQLMRSAPSLTPEISGRILKSIYRQIEFVRLHLQSSHSTVTNNHLLSEAVGLVLVGTIFPEFRQSAVWRANGQAILAKEITRQIYADGVNKEQAIGYHRFVTELFLLVAVMIRRGLVSRITSLNETLEKMLEYLQSSITPDGKVPIWGDANYGRALRVTPQEDFWDIRPLLAMGAVLFQRSDWHWTAGQYAPESFWLLGANSLTEWKQQPAYPPQAGCQAFSEAGVYSLRDGWTPQDGAAFFRCGPFGLGDNGHCGHAHADLLSVQLWVAGQPLLVDSGVYSYQGIWRNPFRQMPAHNTLVVERCEQATIQSDFGWQNIRTALCLAWDNRHISGRIDYGEVQHTRTILHSSREHWQVIDSLEGEGDTECTWYFHLAPGLVAELQKAGEVLVSARDGDPVVLIRPPVGVAITLQTGWYSAQHLHKVSNSVVTGRWCGQLTAQPVEFSWRIEPDHEITGTE